MPRLRSINNLKAIAERKVLEKQSQAQPEQQRHGLVTPTPHPPGEDIADCIYVFDPDSPLPKHDPYSDFDEESKEVAVKLKAASKPGKRRNAANRRQPLVGVMAPKTEPNATAMSRRRANASRDERRRWNLSRTGTSAATALLIDDSDEENATPPRANELDELTSNGQHMDIDDPSSSEQRQSSKETTSMTSKKHSSSAASNTQAGTPHDAASPPIRISSVFGWPKRDGAEASPQKRKTREETSPKPPPAKRIAGQLNDTDRSASDRAASMVTNDPSVSPPTTPTKSASLQTGKSGQTPSGSKTFSSSTSSPSPDNLVSLREENAHLKLELEKSEKAREEVHQLLKENEVSLKNHQATLDKAMSEVLTRRAHDEANKYLRESLGALQNRITKLVDPLAHLTQILQDDLEAATCFFARQEAPEDMLKMLGDWKESLEAVHDLSMRSVNKEHPDQWGETVAKVRSQLRELHQNFICDIISRARDNSSKQDSSSEKGMSRNGDETMGVSPVECLLKAQADTRSKLQSAEAQVNEQSIFIAKQQAEIANFERRLSVELAAKDAANNTAADCQTKVESLVANVQALEAELNKRDRQDLVVKDLRMENDQLRRGLEAEKNCSKERLDTSGKERDILSDKILHLEEDLEKATSKLCEVQNVAEGVEKGKVALEKFAAEKLKEIGALQVERDGLAKQICEIEARCNSLEEAKERIEQDDAHLLRSRAKEFNDEKAKWKSEERRLTGDHKKALNALDSKIKNLESRNRMLEGFVKKLRSHEEDVKELKASIKVYEDGAKSSAEKVQFLEDALASLTTDHETINKQLSDKTKELGKASAEHATMRGKLAAQLKTSSEANSRLQREIDMFRMEKARQDDKYTSLAKELEDLKSKKAKALAELRHEVDTFRVKSNRLNSEKNETLRKLAELREENIRLDNENEDMTKRLNQQVERQKSDVEAAKAARALNKTLEAENVVLREKVERRVDLDSIRQEHNETVDRLKAEHHEYAQTRSNEIVALNQEKQALEDKLMHNKLLFLEKTTTVEKLESQVTQIQAQLGKVTADHEQCAIIRQEVGQWKSRCMIYKADADKFYDEKTALWTILDKWEPVLARLGGVISDLREEDGAQVPPQQLLQPQTSQGQRAPSAPMMAVPAVFPRDLLMSSTIQSLQSRAGSQGQAASHIQRTPLPTQRMHPPQGQPMQFGPPLSNGLPGPLMFPGQVLPPVANVAQPSPGRSTAPTRRGDSAGPNQSSRGSPASGSSRGRARRNH